MNDRRSDVTETNEPRGCHETSVDPQIAASVAVNGCPAWAGDVAEMSGEVAATSTAQGHSGASGAPERRVVVAECPLHTAMRHLTEAAVAQHVLYLEGEVRSRPDLIESIERWQRMHSLIRECICPATREVSVGATELAEIVDSAVDDMFAPAQQHLRAQFLQALAACSACASAAECPLGAESEIG